MYLSAVPFYEASQVQTWGKSINPTILPLSALDKEIERGLVTWKQIHPSKKSRLLQNLAIAALAVVAVGAAVSYFGAASAASAAGGAGTAAGGAGAAGAAATASSNVAATVAAASSGGVASTSSALSLIKSGVGYLSKGAALYSKVTGKPSPPALKAAADLIENSADITDASEKALDYYLAQRGQKIADEKTRELVRERLRREQQAQAQRLRRLAAEEQIKAQHTTGQAAGWWPWLIPAAIVAAKVI